jgi:flagellar protein FlaJ
MSKYTLRMAHYLKTSGLDTSLEKFLKIAAGLLLFFLPVSILAYFLLGPVALIIALGLFILSEILLHFIVISLSKQRAALAEEILPDALRLISSNLRAGIIPERAFMESARPEFGPLSIQIREAGKDLMLGSQLKSAFMKIPEKIDSDMLRKTINLITEGISRGANLSSLLDGLADDMKSTMMLKKDIKAQVASYSMFIFLAIGIGAPILFSASLFLVETLIGVGALLPTQTIQTGGIKLAFSGISLTKDFLLYFQIGMMCVSSLFGSLLMGLISEGKEFAGIKYIPILIGLNLTLFYLIKFVVLASFAVF